MAIWLLTDVLNQGIEFDYLGDALGQLRPTSRRDLHPYMPKLYALESTQVADVKQWAERVQRAQRAPSVCALIETEASVSSGIRHLSRWTVAITPQRAATYLRYFDPRVFEHLSWIWTTDELNSFLQPFQRWALLTSSGDWQAFTPDPTFEGPVSLQWMMGTGQQAALQRVGTIRYLRQHWQAETQLGNEAQCPAAQINQALIQAEQQGLSQLSDQQALVLQRMLVHPMVDQHPYIQHLIQSASNDQPYHRMTCHWTDEQWQTLRHALNSKEVTL